MSDKNNLNNVDNVCSKINDGVQLTDLSSPWKKQVVQKVKELMSQSDHLLSHESSLIASETVLSCP